jgi:hypothetical protein
MNIEQEINNLAIEIQLKDCYGCIYNLASVKNHTCLDDYYYQLAYTQAYDIIRTKYKDIPDSEQVFENYNFGFPWLKQ